MQASDVINLSGAYNVVSRFVTIPFGTTVELAKPNPKRWAIIFSNATAGAMVIWTDQTLTSTRGIVLNAGNPVFESIIKDHASLTQLGWFGNSSGGGDIAIVEILLP